MGGAWYSRLSLRWVMPAAIVVPVLAMAGVLGWLGDSTSRHIAYDLV